MPHSNLIEVNDNNFAEVARSTSTPLLLEFTAVWCPPCRAIAPHVEAVAEKYAGRLVAGKVDLDDNHQLATRFDVRSIPTLLLLRQGQVLAQIVGAVPRAKIDDLVAAAL